MVVWCSGDVLLKIFCRNSSTVLWNSTTGGIWLLLSLLMWDSLTLRGYTWQKCQLQYSFRFSTNNNKPVFSGEEFDAGSMTAVHGVCEWRILINISRVGLHSQLQQYLHTVIFPCCSGPMKRGPDRKTESMMYNKKQTWTHTVSNAYSVSKIMSVVHCC